MRYCRALRDGADDALTAGVAGRILADEERHVPFRCQRLQVGFVGMPRSAWLLVVGVRRLSLLGAGLVVAADHGPAPVTEFGLCRRFIRDLCG